MARIQELEKIECFTSPDFSQQYSVGAVTKRSFQQIANRDGRSSILFAARLETDQVLVMQLDLRRVLDQQDAFVRGNELSECSQQCGLACPGAPAQQDVVALKQMVFQPIGEIAVESPAANEIFKFEPAEGECTGSTGAFLERVPDTEWTDILRWLHSAVRGWFFQLGNAQCH